MSKRRLYCEQHQSPWLDNLTRGYLRDGTLARMVVLWASTSTKNPAYPDTLYVDNLIDCDTVNTLTEITIAAFEDHGTIARTIDTGVDDADAVMHKLAEIGVDIDDVARTLEKQGVTGFHQSFAHVLDALTTKARQLAAR
jgi:transaldolase